MKLIEFSNSDLFFFVFVVVIVSLVNAALLRLNAFFYLGRKFAGTSTSNPKNERIFVWFENYFWFRFNIQVVPGYRIDSSDGITL